MVLELKREILEFYKGDQEPNVCLMPEMSVESKVLFYVIRRK